MIIAIGAGGAVSLQQKHDFQRMIVVIETREKALADRALLEIGSRDGEYMWVSREWLLRAAKIDEAEWRRQFDRMVEAAVRNGWVNAEANSIRVHIVQS